MVQLLRLYSLGHRTSREGERGGRDGAAGGHVGRRTVRISYLAPTPHYDTHPEINFLTKLTWQPGHPREGGVGVGANRGDLQTRVDFLILSANFLRTAADRW